MHSESTGPQRIPARVGVYTSRDAWQIQYRDDPTARVVQLRLLIPRYEREISRAMVAGKRNQRARQRTWLAMLIEYENLVKWFGEPE